MHVFPPFAAALALCLSVQAQASAVTFSAFDTFGGTNALNSTLDRFDPSRGTLTAISLRVSGEVRGGVYVDTGEFDADGNEVFAFYKSLSLRFPNGIDVEETGLFDRTFQVTSFQDYIGAAPLTFAIVYSGSGDYRADITYTYNDRVAAVPVPATLLLVGLGLAALGWVRVRRPAAG